MTDKRIKEDCPFCGTSKNEIQVIVVRFTDKNKGKYTIVSCPKCGCEFHGYGIMNIISKWNTRYR